jgi:hypothetical protein
MTKSQIKQTSRLIRWLIPLLPLVIAWMITVAAEEPDAAAVAAVDTEATDIEQLMPDDDAMSCLECHSNMRYDLEDPFTGDIVSMKMYDELRIDPHVYASSTHGHFTCIDCHSMDYEEHPHPINAKFDFQYNCIDCHGAGEQFADFNFHTIEEEFQLSVHGDHLIEISLLELPQSTYL